MDNQLAIINWMKSYENKTVNESWLVFKDIVHNNSRQFVPQKQERRKEMAIEGISEEDERTNDSLEKNICNINQPKTTIRIRKQEMK